MKAVLENAVTVEKPMIIVFVHGNIHTHFSTFVFGGRGMRKHLAGCMQLGCLMDIVIAIVFVSVFMSGRF